MINKADIRRHFRSLRDALTPREVNDSSRQISETLMSIEEVAAVNTIFCYASIGNEVMTHTLIDRMIESGKTVTTPVTEQRRVMHPHRISSRDELRHVMRGTAALLEPVGSPRFVGRIDLIIAPAVAMTEAGDRLGMGGGYYDRFIELHPNARSIVLAYDCQMTNELPVEEHDQRINVIVTPTRVIRTG